MRMDRRTRKVTITTATITTAARMARVASGKDCKEDEHEHDEQVVLMTNNGDER